MGGSADNGKQSEGEEGLFHGLKKLAGWLYSSRIALRIEDVKFEPQPGREFGPKLVEPVKEIEDGRFELAFGAEEGGVDDFLAQELPQALNQIQVGGIGRQKDLHQGLINQPSR